MEACAITDHGTMSGVIEFYKRKNILLIMFFAGGLIAVSVLSLILFFYSGRYKRAVYRPTDIYEASVVYHIPEKSGTIVSSLQIGETLIIKQRTKDWFFVEKNDGTGGWQKKSIFRRGGTYSPCLS